jgi:hypothetical protein
VAYLMNITILYSISRQREGRRLTDLYFNPPLPLSRMQRRTWRTTAGGTPPICVGERRSRAMPRQSPAAVLAAPARR